MFFNQDFLNQEVRHHCLNNRCLHLQPWGWGWRSEAALSQEVCPAGRQRKRTSDIAKACSAGCGMLREGQKEVGTYKHILEEGAHRRAFLFSCDMLVIHLWSLGDGWSYLLPLRVWRSHVWFGWIHKASVTEEMGLCIRALLRCVCRIHRGMSFSQGTGGAKLSISHLPTRLCLSLCSFCRKLLDHAPVALQPKSRW